MTVRATQHCWRSLPDSLRRILEATFGAARNCSRRAGLADFASSA